MIRLVLLAWLALGAPAFAQSIVDGSDKAWPPEDIAKLMTVMAGRDDLTAGAAFSHVRQAEGAGNDRIYCGVVADGHDGFFMADLYPTLSASIMWAGAQDDEQAGAVEAFNCDKVRN